MDTKEPKTVASGAVPGWKYDIATGQRCTICGDDVPVLIPVGQLSMDTGLLVTRLCEICASLAATVWRRIESGVSLPSSASLLPGSPASGHPASVRVLIVREDEDPTKPLEVLVTGNKYNSPSHRCLPGGKVEPGEDPAAAACRELLEETGLASWPQAMEPLCSGFTLRGRESATFLCRAFSGEPLSSEGLPVHWAPAPISHLAGEYAPYYRGVDTALATRARLKRAAHPGVPLSVCLSEAGAEFVRRRLGRRAKGLAGGDKVMDGLMSVLTEEERGAVELVCGLRFGIGTVPVLNMPEVDIEGEGPVFDEKEGSFEP